MPLKNHSYPCSSSSWRPRSQFFPYKNPPQLIQISSPLWSCFQPCSRNSRLPTFDFYFVVHLQLFQISSVCTYVLPPLPPHYEQFNVWNLVSLHEKTVSPQHNVPSIEQWLQGKGYSEFVFISTLCVQWWLQHYICTINTNLSRF